MYLSEVLYELCKAGKSLLLQVEENFDSSEKQVHDKLTPEVERLISSGQKILEFDYNKRAINKLNSKEKIVFWLILHLIKQGFLEVTTWIQRDFVDFWYELLTQKLSGSDLVFTIRTMRQDNLMLQYYIQEYYSPEYRKRSLFSTLFGKQKDRNDLSLIEKLKSESFAVQIQITSPRKPIKPTFRKGYRDHGSLGSEISKLLKEERNDCWLEEERKKAEKTTEETLAFLRGFLGIE